MILMNDERTTQHKQTMKSGIQALALALLTVQLPPLQAATGTAAQPENTPAATQISQPPDLAAFEKKLDRFIQAFDAIKVQRANKFKDQLMPDMQAEVQHLNSHIKQLKAQLKQARKHLEPQNEQAQQQALIKSLTEQLKALNQRNQRLSFIHKHLKAYPFQARNIKTAGVVRKDMLLEFVTLMKANRLTYAAHVAERAEPSKVNTEDQ
jgi:DNA repair exonuclease SbcCD ATPase subunit